jgi:hypothetical protein
MTAKKQAVTLVCDWDGCGAEFATGRATVRGARGDAERRGWDCQHMAGGRHPAASDNPAGRDLCPRHARQNDGARPAGHGLPPTPGDAVLI